MGFLGVYTTVYDYEPRAEGELAITEGDVLYVLEKGEDDGWWKAKKKASAEDEDEPVGLVPKNYVEEAPVVSHARAIYEYTRQTDEELSFPEEAVLQVYDTSDHDWILVGLDGEYGFVPSNYIEMREEGTILDAPSLSAPPALPVRPRSVAAPKESPPNITSSSSTSAAALASVIQGKARTSTQVPPSPSFKQPTGYQTQHDDSHPSEDREESPESRSPALPSRPRPENTIDHAPNRVSSRPEAREAQLTEEPYRTLGGFHMYNINEMVSVMGKRKKMPTTLGINLGTGTILIAPERGDDDPPQEWSADKMTHYSREGKHVFMELVRPSRSIDFHAGAKDTAEEIVAALGELSGAVRAEGLREVMMASSQRKQRKGHILYDFMAQGDDEVTVAAEDDVVIIDDSKSEDWWQVRRVKNGKEGVVPRSYIEISGTINPPPSSSSGIDSARATVEQNRLEEIRLTKEAIRASKVPQQVGLGTLLPARGSSLIAGENGNNSRQQRSRRENGRNETGNHHKLKSKPDSSKLRTWTDRSGSFSVEAQFLGLKDGKIHLHKMNGVKIAVPIAKMSREDLEYVENVTGISLDDDKPLADVKRAKSLDRQPVEVGASVSRNPKPEYDWFQFFLSCDVPVGLCERYAQAFTKDSMDESVLPDVNATILRTLGLREGDIIKVMRTLDTKFGRERNNQDSEGNVGGLFSGPGGALRNNTRKGRPAPAIQTSDVVDAAAFSKDDVGTSGPSSKEATSPSEATANKSGFDDDAWDVKPHSISASATEKSAKPIPAAAPGAQLTTAPNSGAALTGSMKELSLLTEPLQPSKVEAISATEPRQLAEQQEQPPVQNLSGASPAFFSVMPNSDRTGPISSQVIAGTSPKPVARQRPAPPSISQSQNSLVSPPPQRPLSAPHSAQPTIFSPPALAPQMTGSVQGQVAPPGQSLGDIAQARLQQQYTSQFQPLQPALSGHVSVQPPGVTSFPGGIPGQQQFIRPVMTGFSGNSAFTDLSRQAQFAPIRTQPTGYQASFPPSTVSGFPQGMTMTGNINNFLPQALEPQRPGVQDMQPPQVGIVGDSSFAQPLQPQKTGPPPPVRFGISSDPKKLTSQQPVRHLIL
ncbi:Actin cytoskeleton-regulatory complex protein sla1 [Metarhizium album ARSEF 1941]|uniref:Actin cytoskeleton-regulatory complex protein SLA1 n=1 Tax=Metarhizium album (strain ARSEF 1941) TaxID=1081103 RepID=A0A0B2WYU3_METAS|nr:Actin cytoskeleton-regulatory complex protein sla1 [Metarhizium album ARSEF 1941]KHN98597.1 Actin cytoskeleton-regulatory complex protein sla1 [Metarhizium album ARSEF 1941]